MTIVWRDSTSVGNALIDTDHRYLLCLINTAELALRTERAADVVRSVVDQLKEYTRQDFAREESIMLAARHLRHDHHKMQHRALIDELDKTAKPLLDSGEADVSDEPRHALIALLRHWRVDHIFTEDMQLKPVLSQYPPTYCP